MKNPSIDTELGEDGSVPPRADIKKFARFPELRAPEGNEHAYNMDWLAKPLVFLARLNTWVVKPKRVQGGKAQSRADNGGDWP